MTECFIVLQENRSQILDWASNNISRIIFVLCFDDLEDKIVSITEPVLPFRFLESSDMEYPIDKREVVGKDCDLSQKQLGVMYANIINWLESVQNVQRDGNLNGEYYFHLKIKKYT